MEIRNAGRGGETIRILAMNTLTYIWNINGEKKKYAKKILVKLLKYRRNGTNTEIEKYSNN